MRCGLLGFGVASHKCGGVGGGGWWRCGVGGQVWVGLGGGGWGLWGMRAMVGYYHMEALGSCGAMWCDLRR